MPVAQLAYQFDLIDEGEEPIEWPEAIHIRATQSPAITPKARKNSSPTPLSIEIWIDRQDAQIVHLHARVLVPGTVFQPGSVITQGFTKVGGEIWLPQKLNFRGLVQDGRKSVLAETEQTYTGYHKFKVNSN